MSKHTPGPWQAVKYERSFAYVVTLTPGNARGDICNVVAGLGARMNKEVAANARLISAAPELLGALRDAIASLGGIKSDNVPETARAAIAKATGEQP